jgi:hypothetical protein
VFSEQMKSNWRPNKLSSAIAMKTSPHFFFLPFRINEEGIIEKPSF